MKPLVFSIAYLAVFLAVEGLAGAGTPWNPAPCLALAAVHALGPAALPAAIAAPAIAFLAWGGSAQDGVMQAVVFAGAGLMLRRIDFAPRLERLRDVIALLAAVAGSAALIGVAQAMLGAQDGLAPRAVMVLLAGRFFTLAVAGGAVLPLVFVALARGTEPWRGRPSLETAVQVVSLAVLGWEVFGQFVNEEIRFFYLLFLPFAWIAARHGAAGAAAALAAAYGALTVSHWLASHQPGAIVELQVRMLALAVTSLILGAIVSERRAAERQLEARQAELAHVLRLNIGWEMASGLAHELNQPLAAAMSYGDAGIRFLAPPNPRPEKAIQAFGKALDQIEQAGDIIRRLREFMKKGDLRLALVAVPDIAADAIGLTAAETAASGVAVQALIPPGLPAVLADKTQIVQVIINLLRNAMQAIRGAGAPSGVVQIEASLAGDAVEIAVRDSGPGVSAEIHPRLFEPFVTSKAAGMGLGLSISKSIIEAHAGRMWMERPDGGGAVFRFTLPVAPGKEEVPHA